MPPFCCTTYIYKRYSKRKNAYMSMFNTHCVEMEWAGRPLKIETGRIARQADGAVWVSYGETTILATVCAAKEAAKDADFFPLTIHYLEKSFAIGKIPGGFVKRETKPSDLATLTARLIDRPIRPLFPEGFFNEIQVVCTVLSYDNDSDAEIAGLIAASAALSISGVPFMGPVAAARVAYVNDAYVLNPKMVDFPIGDANKLDLVVAGTREGVLMVESEAQELSEEIMLGAVAFGHEHMQPVIAMIEELKAKVAKPVMVVQKDEPFEKACDEVSKKYKDDVAKAYTLSAKAERYAALNAIQKNVDEALGETYTSVTLRRALEELKSQVVRQSILSTSKRLDGRDLTTVRVIENNVAVLPRVHGSALFTRGETQALVVATLGTAADEQSMDTLDGEYRERFMLHYNFNPYSVGETGRMGAPGRREIGHGRLAWRAVRPLIPSKKDFSYTMRVVSEITESNGSSSMATVCGTSLALMDAGVPLKSPIAGIAMGLIKEGKDYAVLTDILGDEDHLGDMDFKVAGTKEGITALQMDIKITSITQDIMKKALEQAKDGRLHILSIMEGAISNARTAVSDYAPSVEVLKIPRERIRDLIGPGGKVVRELSERFQVKIDIEEDGNVTVAGVDKDRLSKALATINSMFEEPEINRVYKGTITKIMDFGAFVKFLGEREGLVHVSEITGERIERVSDVLKQGQSVEVRFVGTDDRGKVKLSMKGLYKVA